MKILQSKWLSTVLTAALLSVSSVLWITSSAGERPRAGQDDANQSAQASARITEIVDDSDRKTLRGNVHPLARAEFDEGAVSEAQPVTRVMLLLERSGAQEAALRQLLDEQQNPSSPNFHKWLTPQQFGQQFGPADADIETVSAWLASAGFQNIKLSTGRTVLEFSGNVAQVRKAFHTNIHRYLAKGEEHFANTNDPEIPAALAPVVRAIVSLHNFRPEPMLKKVGTFQRNANGEIVPLFTYNGNDGSPVYALGPADFAKIYNIAPTYDGTGQSIAIVGRSNIKIQDVIDFRAMFGLPAYAPGQLQIILNGPDPGLISGDEGESDLDVQWAGAVAPQATIIFVTTQKTETDAVDGVVASELYAINNNVAPVLSVSYGLCEAGLGTGGNRFFNALWQQAAAQGITVIVSAGDSGSAGCDDPNTQTAAAGGLAISGIASTPYNVAIGGTDFDDANNQTPTFWNSTNDTKQASARGYIPESTWNDSCFAGVIPTPSSTCSPTAPRSNGSDLVAGSGGSSTIYTGSLKPSWQTGFGDANRDLPDVSLFAGAGKNRHFYIICQADVNPPGTPGCSLTVTPRSFHGVGGTSAGAPAFAGIIALVNQKTGQRQGNANYVLYALANNENFVNCKSSSFTNPLVPPPATCVFYDITKGNNSVACQGGKPNCSSTTVGQFGFMASGGLPAFNTVAAPTPTSNGYDFATGIGTVNVANLLTAWTLPNRTATSTTLSPANVSTTVGASVTFSGSVTPVPPATGTPTGTVTLEKQNLTAPGTGAAIDSKTLSAGNYNFSTTFLPGGSYNVIAHYGGDGTFATSDSPPVSVTVTKQNSFTRVFFVTFDSRNNPTLNPGPVSVPYGSPYILRIDVLNSTGQRCVDFASGAPQFVCPTGKIILTSNDSPLKDFSNAQTPNATNIANLNDRGFAEDQPIQLSAGAYSIMAAYCGSDPISCPGDNSYNASTSPPLSATITKAVTSTAVTSNVAAVTRGGSVTLTATVVTTSNGAAPSGTVQFKNGSSNLSTAANCAPVTTPALPASCTATLTTALSALPGPFGDSRPKTLLPVILLLWVCVFALFAYAFFFVPSARWRRGAYAGLLLLALAAAAFTGCSGPPKASGPGPRSLTGVYSGDTNYAGSTSLPTVVTVQ